MLAELSERRGGVPEVGYEDSWYHHTARELTAYPALTERLHADVCVIGAGYTGISAAMELAERGFSVVVLEAHRVGAGASGRNGGVLGMGQRKDQDELEKWLGDELAGRLWQLACEANALVRERVNRFEIHCDLTDGELHAAHRERHARALWDYAEHLEKRYGYTDHRPVSAEEMRDMLGTDRFFGGYLDHRAGHLHPLNLALGQARAAAGLGVRIFESSRALGCSEEGGRVVVNTVEGEVSAEWLVLACNGYLGDLGRAFERYQMPINNFMLATEPLGEARARRINRDNVAVVDTRFVVNYFHNSPDHRLLFGGGENYSSRYPRDIKGFVRQHMLEVYPDLEDVAIEFGWGGTLAITLRRMPHFGRATPKVYYAQGYSGHGVAMANLGGKLVAEAIAGQAERFDLFAGLKHVPFPGGRLLRWPALVAGMLYYSMLDRF
ncbi:MAG: FAD-binding oxidoreductase [Pseudomonadales bacterium]|jgi:gamma-glutamylputrescine oxidase